MIFKHSIKAAALVATLGTGMVMGCALAAQPHMDAALDALRTARQELVAATPNKGGHRERAIQLVNQAISQVEMGKAAAR